MMPVPLSYFSPVVGGLPGATALGMEPTYFWDALSDDALDWLNRHTGPGQKVQFATLSHLVALPRADRPAPAGDPADPSRAGAPGTSSRTGPAPCGPIDRALIAQGEPTFVVRKWGVPLVWIFPYRPRSRPDGRRAERLRRCHGP